MIRTFISVAAATLLCSFPAFGEEVSSDRDHSISLQAGWWNVEAEYCADFGLFVNVGVPWFAMVIDGTASGTDWAMGVEGKIGYQFSLTESWKLRAGFRTAFSFWHGCPCMDGTDETHTKSFGFLEAGVRYEHPSGLVVGIDGPLYAFDDLHELLGGNSSVVEHFPPGVSFAFSQVYCGYSWRF